MFQTILAFILLRKNNFSIKKIDEYIQQIIIEFLSRLILFSKS